jgi:uncharacterized protein
MSESSLQNPAPWWKFGHVWLIISGPAAVILAGFFTLYLAVSGVDPVIDTYYHQQRLKMKQGPSQDPANLAPAQQARNHAATGVPPAKE